MEQHVFSVTEVNQYIKSIIDGVPQLSELLIRGELSNYPLRHVPGQRGEAALPARERHAGHRRGTHQRLSP